jgi:hypothetical protein
LGHGATNAFDFNASTALPHPGRGNADFAEPGEVPVILENDDGTGDAPCSTMIAAARWLIDNDAEVEQAIIATIGSSLDELINIQDGIDGVTDEVVNETWKKRSCARGCAFSTSRYQTW